MELQHRKQYTNSSYHGRQGIIMCTGWHCHGLGYKFQKTCVPTHIHIIGKHRTFSLSSSSFVIFVLDRRWPAPIKHDDPRARYRHRMDDVNSSRFESVRQQMNKYSSALKLVMNMDRVLLRGTKWEILLEDQRAVVPSVLLDRSIPVLCIKHFVYRQKNVRPNIEIRRKSCMPH